MDALVINKRIVVNELLPVYETDIGSRVVDARELHSFLSVGRDFSSWIKERIEKYGFIDGDDFSPVLVKTSDGGRPRTEYTLKLDMAKELCMVENNEQGSRARKYFIEVERRFRHQQVDVNRLNPEMQMFNHLFNTLAQSQLQAQENERRLNAVTETVEVIQETLLRRDDDWRRSINGMLNGAAYRLGIEFREIRNQSYRILEERGHCDLNTRLRNLTKRLEDSGATKTQMKEANKLDLIENDPRLKEIYSSVVKELSIGTLRIAK